LDPIVQVRSNLKWNPSEGQNVIGLCSVILELIGMILEVQFALKDEGAKFPGVGTIEWIGFPKLRLGFGGAIVGFDDLIDGLGECFGFVVRVGGT